MPQGTGPKTITTEDGTFYSEEELRRRVGEALKEAASIVYSAFSFPAAHQRILRRAAEIEAGGPFEAPPSHWGKA